MNHYCTYFDRRYAQPGLAMWLSLKRCDAAAVLWVLCLDDATAELVRGQAEPDLRAVPLAELEAADPALAAVRSRRTWVEYVFTLSPCLPRHLLGREPGLAVITYVDADMAFFSAPTALSEAMRGANVLVVGHRFPAFLRQCEVRGRFNVGILGFRNNAVGRACLDDWRVRCLEWCHDRVEPGRYADQKYLDAWPGRFPGTIECRHPGVNLAPWNWLSHDCRLAGGRMWVDGKPLVAFHFARFRPLGRVRADSGQLEYGVMPLRLRSWLYGRYWKLLGEARDRIRPLAPDLPETRRAARGDRAAWKTKALQSAFGSVWWRVGPWWISGRGGLGRFSGRVLAWFDQRVKRSAAVARLPRIRAALRPEGRRPVAALAAEEPVESEHRR